MPSSIEKTFMINQLNEEIRKLTTGQGIRLWIHQKSL